MIEKITNFLRRLFRPAPRKWMNGIFVVNAGNGLKIASANDEIIGVATEAIKSGETIAQVNPFTGEVRYSPKFRPMDTDTARKLGGMYSGPDLPE